MHDVVERLLRLVVPAHPTSLPISNSSTGSRLGKTTVKEPQGSGHTTSLHTRAQTTGITTETVAEEERRRSETATAAGPARQGVPHSCRNQQKNAAADKTRSAAPRIRAPHHAQAPPRSPPHAQHCWSRCRSSSGGSAPTPAAARGCGAVASSPQSSHCSDIFSRGQLFSTLTLSQTAHRECTRNS